MVLSSFLLAWFVGSHAGRPDGLMLLTIIPVFTWLVIGLVLSAGIRTHRHFRLVLFASWMIFAFALGDSPLNLVRQCIPPDSDWVSHHQSGQKHDDKIPVRIISFNCMKQSSGIAQLSSLNPDVVLLQESASELELKRLLETHFSDYQLVWSRDTSILVRGQAKPFPLAAELKPRYQFAAATLANGAQFNVVSVHLQHSPRQLDIWNLSSWKLFADLRRLRRRQLDEIRAEMTESIGTAPVIIGGDFNAPARDQIYETMHPRFRDAWAEAGRGWGKTSLNQFPVHRIDQIWITEHFDSVNVRAKKTTGSDHRMVICDLWVK